MNASEEKNYKPVFLLLAVAIPAGWVLFLMMAALSPLFPDSGGHVGDNDMGGIGIFISTAILSVVLSVVFSIIAAFRAEQFLGQGVGLWIAGAYMALVFISYGATALFQTIQYGSNH